MREETGELITQRPGMRDRLWERLKARSVARKKKKGPVHVLPSPLSLPGFILPFVYVFSP